MGALKLPQLGGGKNKPLKIGIGKIEIWYQHLKKYAVED
jgi:hypothetical protein